MSDRRLVWIHSTNETPRCGSGQRPAFAEVGSKWVRLWPAGDSKGRPDKIPVSVFNAIYVREVGDVR